MQQRMWPLDNMFDALN